MKTKIYSWFLAAFLAVFAVSCSESEDLMPEETQMETHPATRADSPLLMTSPTEVYFTNTEAGTIARDTVNVKIAGLPLLASLTNFDVVIQGEDASQFSYEEPQLGLIEFLQALLGGGINIPVSYSPSTIGSHEAELLITASLLGVLMPVQITVPLHGTAVENSGPKLVRTIPVNEGNVEFEGRVPDRENTGQYHIDFIFDRDIIIKSGVNVRFPFLVTTAEIQTLTIVNGNTLRVIIWDLLANVQGFLLVDVDAVAGRDDLEEVGNKESTLLVYNVVGDIPDNEIEE